MNELQLILGELREIKERLGRLELTRPRNAYSVKEAAALLGRSEWTVRRWCELGLARGAKQKTGRGNRGEWRLPPEEVDRLKLEGPG